MSQLFTLSGHCFNLNVCCCCSVAKSCSTVCDPMDCSTPDSSLLHYVPVFAEIHASSHIILYRPLLLLPSVFLSIRIFSNESAVCIRWPKYWRFSFSISPSLEYSGLIFFRIDWFDLFAVQGTLQSLLQHHFGAQSSLRSSSHVYT